ncbi:MAG: hypothetical protein Q7S70_00890 [bacterium]|nr:hypothetical protein [bacterium]
MNPIKTKLGKFKRAYSKKHLIAYIKGVAKAIKRSPTYRDLKKFPGPTSSTIIRRFGKWSIAIKKADLRPVTHQLLRGEKTYIRKNWRLMTDKQIASGLKVPLYIIRYYRLSKKLWKNTRNKRLVKSTQKKIASKLYGNSCEVCNIPITELHHIISGSKLQKNWAILCPLCHEIISRKIITIKGRIDLFKKLKPFVKKIYSNLSIL